MALSGCGIPGVDDRTGTALVRFVEVSPGSPEVDFFVNGTGAAYGLGYESFTSYLPVSPGSAAVRTNRSGRSTTLATAEGYFNAGRQYTVVLSRGLSDMQQQIFADQESPAVPGQLDLRLINAVEGSPGLVFHITADRGGPDAAERTVNLKAGAATAYLHLAAGRSYQVAASQPEPGLTTPLSVVVVPGTSGAVRTVVFAGTAGRANHARTVSFLLGDVDGSR